MSTDVSKTNVDSPANEVHAFLASIIQHSSDAIITKRLDGTITSWNRSAERVFGYPADEAIGRNIKMLIPIERLREEDYFIDRIRRHEFVEHYESQRQTKYGQLIDVDLSISPICDSSGKVIGASKIARDITRQKADERALRDSEAKFRHLADAMPDLVWQADPVGRMVYQNQRWQQVTGLELAGTNGVNGMTEDEWRKIVHPDDYLSTQYRWQLALAAMQPFTHECRLRDRHGHYRCFLIRAIPVKNMVGGVDTWFGTCTDIDDLRRAEQHAKAQQLELAHLERIRSMGQMASGLAHELNQPLGAIVNYGAAVQMRLANLHPPAVAEECSKIVGEVMDQAARASEIIRRLRAFVRKQKPQMIPRDLRELVTDVIRLMAFELRTANIQPHLELGYLPPIVAVDSVQIQQVLVNLVKNAIEAMSDMAPEKRELTISVFEEQGDGITINVADSGPGVSAEHEKKIFDSFFTTKPHGLGMGLALCKTIVEEHGGHLSARHREVGGMVFSVRFAGNLSEKPSNGVPFTPANAT